MDPKKLDINPKKLDVNPKKIDNINLKKIAMNSKI